MGAKVPVHSEFNLPNGTNYLLDYPDKVVVDSLQFGWSLNFPRSIYPQENFQESPFSIQKPRGPRKSCGKRIKSSVYHRSFQV